MKKIFVLVLLLAPCVGMASPGNTVHKNPEAYLEFGGGFVSHSDKDFPGDIEQGAAVDFALGVNQRKSLQFSHGLKLTLDNLVDGRVTCNDPACLGEEDDFHITSLAANYDLDWRFVKPVSLLFSIGAGPSWSSLFVDNSEFMIRGSLGVGFHVARGLQITLAGVGNFFPVMSDDAEYSVIRGMLGLRWAWD